MITSFLLSLAGTFASENDIWSTWNDIVGDTFGDDSWTDTTTETGFTDFIWDQVDFGDATASSSSSLFEGWLTGIDINDYISDSNADLQSMLDSIGDTSDMDTSQIVDAINDVGFNPTDYGWSADADLEEVLDEMSAMVTDFEVLAWMEGWDLGEFPALDGMESTLTDFGFDDLYGLEDINEFFSTTVEEAIPDSYTDYEMDLSAIEDGLTQIISGDSDAPSMEDVLGELESMIDSMEIDVDEGATDLQDALEDLQSVYTVLSFFGYGPVDMLLLFAEDLDSLFADTDFDYDGLDDALGSDWLDEFETAMEELSGANDAEVCETDFVRNTLLDQYPNYIAFVAATCGWMELDQAPNCDCLDGADIYGNEDKSDVQESLMCLYSEGDDLTVEQTLRECNGEDVEVDMTLDAFEILDELTGLLTLDNYLDLDTDLVDTSSLSEQYDEIISAIEDLSNTEIDTNGTDEDYMDSLSSWIDNFESLVNDLDVDGSYAEQSDQINDMLDDAFSTFQSNMETDSSPKKENGIEWWIWILIAIAAFFLICVVCGFTVYQRNRKLARLAIGIESETYAQVEGGEAPLVPSHGGTTAGGEM